ncbi:MAG: hypothetical protein K6G85_05210 [Eubacterium sp.]|nr:hypothetical protein [Eubacterium sp.]
MLTVIIAPKEYIEKIEENSLFLSVLSTSEQIAFCECNYDGETLDEMVPELYESIARVEEWRALVIAPENRYHINPYDFTEYDEEECHTKKTDWNFYNERREKRFACYEKAINNPLVKLTSALIDTAYSKLLITRENYESIIHNKMQQYEYMLQKCLESLDLNKLVFQLDAMREGESQAAADYRMRQTENQYIYGLVGPEKYNDLILAIKNREYSEICKMIGPENVLKFNRALIGEDPEFTDPEFLESQLFNFKKMELLQPLEEKFKLHTTMPASVHCIALRDYDVVTFRDGQKHKPTYESTYSRFVEFNLYPSRTQFLVYDILEKEDKRYEKELMKFLATVLVLANYGLPMNVMSGGYLYYLEPEFDNDEFRRICEHYVGKLSVTHSEIRQKIAELSEQRDEPLEDKDAEELFENLIHIPVELRKIATEDDMLIRKRIGLSTNCPNSESDAWKKRSAEIDKQFVKYMREPRRAVKISIDSELNPNSRVKDDRILRMTDFQLENIEFQVEEEEQKMMEVETEKIFDVDSYRRELQAAGDEITKEIGHRMKCKTTVLTGVWTLLLFLFGSLAFFRGNFKTNKIKINTVEVVGVGLILITVLAMIVLFYYRYRLRTKIKRFNGIIEDIKERVSNSIGQFSIYLSHMANVMRKNSILNYGDRPDEDMIKALNKHRIDIERIILDTQKKYSGYFDEKCADKSIKAYDYDFTQLVEYEYPPIEEALYKKIEYAHTGYNIDIPVNYLNCILIAKEDLYD